MRRGVDSTKHECTCQVITMVQVLHGMERCLLLIIPLIELNDDWRSVISDHRVPYWTMEGLIGDLKTSFAELGPRHWWTHR